MANERERVEASSLLAKFSSEIVITLKVIQKFEAQIWLKIWLRLDDMRPEGELEPQGPKLYLPRINLPLKGLDWCSNNAIFKCNEVYVTLSLPSWTPL